MLKHIFMEFSRLNEARQCPTNPEIVQAIDKGATKAERTVLSPKREQRTIWRADKYI